MKKWIKYILCISAILISSSCAELSYYGQAIDGHWQLLEQRQPVRALLANPSTSEHLRERLAITHELRDFATHQLALPNNGSYRSYVDLGRPHVVYNVFAASDLSLQAKSWCFPVLGCVNYRGYFDINQAHRLAEQLRQQGNDVYVANIPAYSTLGWFDDPLLNTFLHWPVGRIAELMFHELAHQQLYIADDTAFNESFASAVGQLGAELWLQNKPTEQHTYQQYQRYRNDFLELIASSKNKLAALYDSAQSIVVKRQEKQRLFDKLKRRYKQLKKQQWNGYNGYDNWFAQDLNNAKLAAINIYTQYVPAFLALFDSVDNDFPAFYRKVELLAELSKEQRRENLKIILKQSLTSTSAAVTVIASTRTPTTEKLWHD